MTVSQKTLEDWKRNAIMEALGHALAFADPDDPDCHVGSIHDNGEDNRRIREESKLYIVSWVVAPLAAALGVGPLHPFEHGSRSSVKAEAYLAELKAALER